ncbi:hypothetical protein JCM21714_3599 [Gracilibacillus boraciitolerans JCM 21714]|uniref:Uncharacterized protein n=1 Tax=Gracilibacillus boraciitolerans JCM 21714 TaxID=1298598 RepID=W4VNQ3_9BACI|nr:hypothetical protein [Gracilibacillus boraciitolerans]GAE94443.1 hypothetical protein JCM21714_3599 [Gracilibacillus boraciitolerans JCM 21714]
MYQYPEGMYQQDEMKKLCQKYMSYYVAGQLHDGSEIEGIIDSIDNSGVTMLIPEEIEEEQMNRQYGYYGPGRRRYRRFRRQRYPFGLLTNLLLYPFFILRILIILGIKRNPRFSLF